MAKLLAVQFKKYARTNKFCFMLQSIVAREYNNKFNSADATAIGRNSQAIHRYLPSKFDKMNQLKIIAMSCLAAFSSVAYSEETFVPLSKVREQVSCPDYGPSLKEIIHPTFQDVIKEFECLIVTRLKDDAKDELLLYSSLCIAGQLVAEKGKPYFVNEFKQLRDLSKLLLNYDSYGDQYMTMCQPDVAFEFISKKGRVVLLYDSKLKMGHFANVVFKLDDPTLGMYVTFDKPVNKILLKLLEDAKKTKTTHK